MPQPVGAAPLERLPDGRQAERLAGVDGEVVVLALEVLEGVQVPGGRVTGLGARDVEADHAEVAVAVGEFGDLQGAGRVPHGGEQGADADAVTGGPGPPLAFPEALVDGLDDLFEGEPALQVLLGGVAHLGVDDAVLGEVLGALGGDPDQGVAGLHDADGVGEGLEVPLQRTGVGCLAEPGAEPVRVGLRELRVARGSGEFDDRAGAQPAVEVIVQQNLRRPADVVRRRRPRAGLRGALARHFRTLTPTRVEHRVNGRPR